MPVVQVPEETCWVVTIVVCECAMTARKKWYGGVGWGGVEEKEKEVNDCEV